jgi:hypothetical protein
LNHYLFFLLCLEGEVVVRSPERRALLGRGGWSFENRMRGGGRGRSGRTSSEQERGAPSSERRQRDRRERRELSNGRSVDRAETQG